MKQFLLLFFVLATTLVFSQNDADYVALQKDIKNENIKGLVNFQKACKLLICSALHFQKGTDAQVLTIIGALTQCDVYLKYGVTQKTVIRYEIESQLRFGPMTQQKSES